MLDSTLTRTTARLSERHQPRPQGRFWLMIARKPGEEQWNGRRHDGLLVLRMRQYRRPALQREKVAKELRHYRRKGPGPTTRGLRDGFVSIDFDREPSSTSAAVLASSVSSCSTPDSVEPSWWRPRLRTLRLLQKRLFVVDGRRQQSWSMVILWLSRASWHQPPPLPLIALCAAIRFTNGFSSRRCGSQNTVSRCRIPEIVGS